MYSEVWQHDGHTSGDPIVTHTGLHLEEHNEVCDTLTTLLADLFALYVKTKVFHRHASGSGPRGRRLLLAEQADQILVKVDTVLVKIDTILVKIDTLGERVRALGGTPIRSIGEISRLHWIGDSASTDLTTREMLAALLRDTRLIAKQMRRTYALCRTQAISPARACWRSGSTRPRAATGFSSRCTARIEAGQRTGRSDVK